MGRAFNIPARQIESTGMTYPMIYHRDILSSEIFEPAFGAPEYFGSVRENGSRTVENCPLPLVAAQHLPKVGESTTTQPDHTVRWACLSLERAFLHQS